MSPRDQLRAALNLLQADDGENWCTVLAEEIVRRGGGDAVDLLHVALDDALVVIDPDEVEQN